METTRSEIEQEREAAIATGISDALGRSIALAFLLTAGLVLAGHLFLAGGTPDGWLPLRLIVRERALVERVAVIAAWDLGSAFLFLRWWKKPSWRSRAGEALMALVASLILWRVVWGVVLGLSVLCFPNLVSAWVMAYAPVLTRESANLQIGLGLLWAYAIAVGAAKEKIARDLFSIDGRFGTPLCTVFAWHHRKDAVFTALFALASTAVALDVSVVWSELLISLLKLILLGSASLAIFRRCAVILTGDGTGGITPDGMHGRMDQTNVNKVKR
ncbi:MAG TPA: hypothetical protein PKM25_13920 [Candidatus Ozemobacteraceae bacterium]|nr:hypothetical protein [Candidatus Ozemobacteraceae bacterium]